MKVVMPIMACLVDTQENELLWNSVWHKCALLKKKRKK